MPPLAAAFAVVLLEAFAFGAALPVLSYYSADFTPDERWVGWLFALVSLPKIFSNSLFGRWSDHIGRKPVLAIGTLGTLAGSIGWAIAPSIWFLAASRLVTGIFGIQAGVAQAVAADVTSPKRRAAAAGMLGAAFGLAITFGPLVGALVAQRFSHRAVGWAMAALEATSLLIILFALRETRPAHADDDPQAPNTVPPLDDPADGGALFTDRGPFALAWWRNGVILALLGVVLLSTIGQSEMISTLGLLCEQRFGYTVRQTSYAFAVFGLVGIVVQGGLVRVMVARMGETPTAIIGLFASAVGLWGIGVSTHQSEFYASVAAFAVGAALAVPAISGLISRLVSPRQQGAVLGVYQSVTSLGRGAGNALGATLYGVIGAGGAYGIAAGVSIAAAGLLFPLLRHTRPAATEETADSD